MMKGDKTSEGERAPRVDLCFVSDKISGNDGEWWMSRALSLLGDPSRVSVCTPEHLLSGGVAQPRVIVSLGKVATQKLLETTEGIMSLRGKWKLFRGKVPLMPTFHPGLVRYQSDAVDEINGDILKAIRAAINGDILKAIGAAGGGHVDGSSEDGRSKSGGGNREKVKTMKGEATMKGETTTGELLVSASRLLAEAATTLLKVQRGDATLLKVHRGDGAPKRKPGRPKLRDRDVELRLLRALRENPGVGLRQLSDLAGGRCRLNRLATNRLLESGEIVNKSSNPMRASLYVNEEQTGSAGERRVEWGGFLEECRRVKEQRVVKSIRERPGVAMTELAQSVGGDYKTVLGIVDGMIERGEVVNRSCRRSAALYYVEKGEAGLTVDDETVGDG